MIGEDVSGFPPHQKQHQCSQRELHGPSAAEWQHHLPL